MIEGSRFTDARDIVGLAASPVLMIPHSGLKSPLHAASAQVQPLYGGCSDIALWCQLGAQRRCNGAATHPFVCGTLLFCQADRLSDNARHGRVVVPRFNGRIPIAMPDQVRLHEALAPTDAGAAKIRVPADSGRFIAFFKCFVIDARGKAFHQVLMAEGPPFGSNVKHTCACSSWYSIVRLHTPGAPQLPTYSYRVLKR